MTQLRGIDAEYVNWRTVMGRKVLQLVFEIDIARQQEVLTMLGTPTVGESKWVAIALLENNGSASVNGATSQKQTQRPSSAIEAPNGPHGGTPLPITVSTAETGTSETQAHARKSFASLPLSQQAAIRCGDVLFQEFVRAENEADAASAVRVACDISSRSGIIHNSRAGEQWQQLERQYQAWLTDRKFAEAKR